MNIKNIIYEEYLNSNMHESELINQLDNIQEKSIKNAGVIYTPWNIVKEMIVIASPTNEMKIIEPSCGHGIFIFGLLEYMQENYKISGKDLLDWFLNKVIAIDISKTTVIELQDILSVYFKKHFNIIISNEYFHNIIAEDSLYYKSEEQFDLAIGNPPYIRTKNLNEIYLKELRTNFKSCVKGNVDIYYAFIEKCLKISKETCLITPNSFITNISAKNLRIILYKNIDILIDFRETLIFKDARIYTAIVKFSQKQNNTMLYANNIGQPLNLIDKGMILDIKNKPPTLSENILSEMASLANSTYLVRKQNEKYYAEINNKKYEIEEGILAPYLKMTKIKNTDLSKIDYMICPYTLDKKIIPEDTLKIKYPKTYLYLLEVKEKLMQRDKGKIDKYEAWYAYGRKQGLHNIIDNIIVVIPKLIGKDCKPIKLDIEHLLKNFGRVLFTAGFIVPQNRHNIERTESFLSESFIQFVELNGKPWPGKTESYFAINSNQIKTYKKGVI